MEQQRQVQMVAPEPAARAPRQRKAPAGWPFPPVYDAEHRARTADELDAVQHENSDWKTVCNDLMTKNQGLLETGSGPGRVCGLWGITAGFEP